MTLSLWAWILLAALVAYATKLIGYLLPARWLQNDRMTRVAAALTIGLLASLTAINALSVGQVVVLDARIGAAIAAGVALKLQVPFLGVVAIGAAAAALLRLANVG